jgi:hypothetical protein
MEFSWWTWSGIVALALVGFGFIGRAVVMAVRREGVGRARADRDTSAPWFWSGIRVAAVAAVLLLLWADALAADRHTVDFGQTLRTRLGDGSAVETAWSR